MGLLGWAKALVPRWVKESLKAMHRRWVFGRAMAEARTLLARRLELPGPLLERLVYGWGNDAWSAREEFLQAIVAEAGRPGGPIVECGSGLSTLLMGLATLGSKRPVVALENHPEWAERVRGEARRFGLSHVDVVAAPLRDFGPYTWYDPPTARVPGGIGMVVCDGPPDTTPGGRYGMLPQLRRSLAAGCVIFLDDLERAGEQEILRRWAAELGVGSEVFGTAKPYGRVAAPG